VRSHKIAVRQSFFALVALALLSDSADLSTFPDLEKTDDGRYAVEDAGVTYGVVPKLVGEDFDQPGVNVVFGEDFDTTPERYKTKRYVVPVQIVVSRPLAAREDALGIWGDVRALADEIDRALRGGFVEIWDYEGTPPDRVGTNANWVRSEATWRDESLPVEGGDVRLTRSLELEYVEPNS
jgi:hypothetical protein